MPFWWGRKKWNCFYGNNLVFCFQIWIFAVCIWMINRHWWSQLNNHDSQLHFLDKPIPGIGTTLIFYFTIEWYLLIIFIYSLIADRFNDISNKKMKPTPARNTQQHKSKSTVSREASISKTEICKLLLKIEGFINLFIKSRFW